MTPHHLTPASLLTILTLVTTRAVDLSPDIWAAFGDETVSDEEFEAIVNRRYPELEDEQ